VLATSQTGLEVVDQGTSLPRLAELSRLLRGERVQWEERLRLRWRRWRWGMRTPAARDTSLRADIIVMGQGMGW